MIRTNLRVTMLEATLGLWAAFIAECLFRALPWLLCLPLLWAVSLPFILVFALFRPTSYHFAVLQMLRSVYVFWRECVDLVFFI